MSFDLYVQSFENGAPAPIPHALVREVFGSHLSEIEPDYWTLDFGPNESCSLFPSVLDGTPDCIQSLSIGNPCDDLRLWQGLTRLMEFGHTVLYFPGGSGPLVLGILAASHMPSDMRESLGPPIVIGNAQDIRRVVRAA